MEEILEKILNELKYHSTLLGEISMAVEKPKHSSKEIHASMNLLKEQIAKNPAIAANPELGKMITDMFKIIPNQGGE